jgi:hypothetical protein
MLGGDRELAGIRIIDVRRGIGKLPRQSDDIERGGCGWGRGTGIYRHRGIEIERDIRERGRDLSTSPVRFYKTTYNHG